MALIGSLLMFILPFVFLYSLFKPKAFNIRTKKNSTGKWTRTQSVLLFAAAWFISIVMIVNGSDIDLDADTAQSNDVKAVDNSVSKPIAEPTQKEPSRKERKAAEKAQEAANKEAELVKDDLQRISTLVTNNTSRPILPNGWSRTDLYVNCQLVLEKQLKSPKSFNSERGTVKFIREAEEEIIGVNFDFYATNSFGAELIHNGTCMYNFDGELLDSSAKAK